jgi:DNA-directed RNA polymerase subunit M/transcription elongation factor TFIIS
MMISPDEGPDALTDDDLDDCPECGEGKMYPLVRRTLVSDTNPQRYECNACHYEEDAP